MVYKKNLEIQKLIKKEREKQGISIRSFAKKMGCTHRSISYWDKCEKVMTLEMADRALKVLRITVTIGKEKNT